MKATIRIGEQQRLQIEATAGDVLLQFITDQPMSIHGSYPPKVATARLTATQAAILIDTLAGVACVAEEQAFDLDLAVAMVAAGHAPPPRDFTEPRQSLAPFDADMAPLTWFQGARHG